MDPKITKKTQDSLGKFIKKPPLTEKLLSKPPFRFLHDIMTSVIKTTGFMKGLYTDAEMVSENVKDKDAKVAFLQKAIDAVVAVTGKSLAVKPVKIVAGHEPERTNEFLQALAMAINANANNDEIVKKVLSGNSAVSKDGGDRDDRKDKGSAGRRKEPEDKVKKDDDDKQKSRERDKDKGRSDRRGDGDTAEKEKEKEHSRDRDRDRREKSRDREDRHRDKDVDKDRDKRKKTQVKSGDEFLKDESPVAKESECSSMIHDVKEQYQTNKRSGDLFQAGTKLGSQGRNSLLGLHAASSLPQSVPQISRKPDQTSIRKHIVGADREGTKQGNLMSSVSKHPSADFIPSQGDRHHLAQKGSSSNPTILVQDPRQTSKELKSSPTKSSVLPDHKLLIPPSSVIKFIKEEPKAQSSTKGKIRALRFPSRAPDGLTTSRPAVVNPLEPVHHIEKSKRTHGESTAHGSKSSTNLQEFHLTSGKAAESPPTKVTNE